MGLNVGLARDNASFLLTGSKKVRRDKDADENITVLDTRNKDSKKVVSHLSGKQRSWNTEKSFAFYITLVD